MFFTIVPTTNVRAAKKIKVKKISLNKSSCVVKKKKKIRLKATVKPGKAKNKIKWSSSNKKIATVSSKGVVKAIKKGKVTITAKVGNQKAKCKIIVGTPVKSIKVSDKKITLRKGGNVKIKTSVLPVKASVKKLSYTSKNKKVATVNKKGMISAKGIGTTTITVKSMDGNNKSAKVNVSVQEAQVAVSGISLSEAKKTIGLNQSVKLAANVLPVNATNKKVTWQSNNPSVAVVGTDGTVTGKSKGTAEITVKTVDGGYSAVCSVAVANVVEVKTDEEIAKALSDKTLDELRIRTNAKGKLTIPKGNYEDVTLIVDVPKGEVVNNGRFQSISIQQIAKDTYIENARGNRISVDSAQAHVVVGSDGQASIFINKTSKDVVVDNNGTIQSLELNTTGKIKINGKSNRTIKVRINDKANLTASQPLDVDAISKFALTIRPGGEDTVIAVSNKGNMPTINGLGIIMVTISDTGEIVSVVSDNNGADESAVNVTFSGAIVDINDELLSDINVYLVPYKKNYDIRNIVTDAKAVKLKTDNDGHYTTSAIKTGNYILAAKGSDYADTEQTLVIGTSQGAVYTNEEITMIPSSWSGKSGNIAGNVVDSATGDSIPQGITINIRKNKNNIVGNVFKTTKTDEDGSYSFSDVAAGCYTVQFVDMRAGEMERYTMATLNVVVRPDGTVNGSGSMTKKLAGGEVRFILSWGDESSGAIADADSHLVGPMPDGKKFHTYYSNKTAEYENKTCAALDVDDTEYVGPETTTIYDVQDGKYSYYVHDFTNCDSSDSDALARSSVKVSVYRGARLVADYHIPQEKGTLWHVCDYDSKADTFKTINQMSYESYPEDVGMGAVNKKARIEPYIEDIETYYSLLESGTGEDVKEKANAYRKRLQTISDDEITAANVLYNDVLTYYDSLLDECKFSVYGEDVDDFYISADTNTVSVYPTNDAESMTKYQVEAGESNRIEKITPEDSQAFDAYKVTAANGHVRIMQLYIDLDLDYIGISCVSKTGHEADCCDIGWYSDENNNEYGLISIYSSSDTETPDDYTISFDSKLIQIEKNVVEVDDKYTITISYGSRRITYVVEVFPIPKLTDPDNTIYVQRMYNGCLYCIGKKDSLGKDFIVSSAGETLSVVKESDNGGSYDLYYLSGSQISCYLQYYQADAATAIDELDLLINDTDTKSPDLNNETNTIIIKNQVDLVRSIEIDNIVSNINRPFVSYSCQTVMGKDYIATLTIQLSDKEGNVVSGYERVYKIYAENIS